MKGQILINRYISHGILAVFAVLGPSGKVHAESYKVGTQAGVGTSGAELGIHSEYAFELKTPPLTWGGAESEGGDPGNGPRYSLTLSGELGLQGKKGEVAYQKHGSVRYGEMRGGLSVVGNKDLDSVRLRYDEDRGLDAREASIGAWAGSDGIESDVQSGGESVSIGFSRVGIGPRAGVRELLTDGEGLHPLIALGMGVDHADCEVIGSHWFCTRYGASAEVGSLNGVKVHAGATYAYSGNMKIRYYVDLSGNAAIAHDAFEADEVRANAGLMLNVGVTSHMMNAIGGY